MEIVSPSIFNLLEDQKEAKRVFNSLPLKNQLEIALQARGKERIRYLFISENPEQLIRQLPELEVFWTIKEVGEKDAIDLISLTTPEQFQYLLDMDLWKKDQLDPEKTIHWIEILLESGEQKTVQFIRSTDLELITLLLKKFLHVTTLEGECLEARDRIPLFTLDQYYFIDFKEIKTREVLQSFLQLLYRIDGEEYRRLMENLIWELESNLEEEGYRLKNVRLAEYGFPDFEEALEIYRFVNPNSLMVEKVLPLAKGPEEIEKSNSTFYLTFQNEGPFFSSILSKVVESSEMNRLKYEITVLCNKAMIVEAIDLSNMEEIKEGVKKVFHYLNLGLQYLSNEEDFKASEILRSIPIQRIFQNGVGATVLLRKKAEAMLGGSWFNGNRENLVFLDSPWLEKIEGLLKKRPCLYRNGEFEDFRNIKDLKEIEIFLEFIESIVNTLGKQLNVYPSTLRTLDLQGCHPQGWNQITWSTVFLTYLANQILKGAFQFKAIEKEQMKDLLPRIFEKDEHGKGIVKMEIKNWLMEWFDSIESNENLRQHLQAFGDFCFDLLEVEYGRIPPEEEIDPRFIKGLLIHT